MSNEPVFSEREVIGIIERAVELQARTPQDGAKHGLTLRELEHLGREVGLAPEHLRRAASEAGFGADLSTQNLDAQATHIRAERWIPGRLPESAIEELFGEMQTRLGPDSWAGWGSRPSGAVERVGRTCTWNHSAARFTVTDEGDGYTVRVFKTEIFNGKRSEGVWASLWAALAFGGLLGGAVGEEYGVLWFVLIMAVACAISFATVPRMIRQKRERSEQHVEALAHEAELFLLAAAGQSGERLVSPAPVLSLPDEDEGVPANVGRSSAGRSSVVGTS